MKKCGNCGYENADGVQFCHNCGLNMYSHENDDLIHKIFYKKDKYTGELRIAKTNTISIVVFILFFIIEIAVASGEIGFAVTPMIIAAFIFGLIFAVPTWIAGYIIAFVIDKITN